MQSAIWRQRSENRECNMLRTTILIDNISNRPELLSEWGLAMLIEYDGMMILLDTGASAMFTENAKILNVDLSGVDFAVLSHAHYDHSDGMEAFFQANSTAKMYLSPNACENCYHIFRKSNIADLETTDEEIVYDENGEYKKYDGIAFGWLEKYKNRIVYANEGVYEISKGVYLVPHNTPGLEELGEKVGQYIKVGEDYIPDDYSHEQSLVLKTDEGMVVYNSCSHAGVDNIIREVEEAFPGEKVCCMIGGFHLFMFDEEEVREQARRMAATGIKHIVTGHCTGADQYKWLADELGKYGVRAEQMESGLVIE